jgi:anion-transporting  ArsA/GET3 family ATPase
VNRKTQLHIVTGKGGVGKSTFAASLCQALAANSEGPILLIEVQGSGRSLGLLGLEDHFRYEAQAVPELNNVWASRILPRPAFREYFNLLLAMGKQESTFANLTSSVRERVVDTVLQNKVVSAFVDVCPGLEPAALLGKVHWECTEGLMPDSSIPWKHVVMDAPSTGHAVMLFKSTQALIDVFGTGIVFRQASEIMSLVRNTALTRLYILSTPEELPLKEAYDLSLSLKDLRLPEAQFILNREKPLAQDNPLSNIQNLEKGWAREVEIELERGAEEKALVEEFLAKNTPPDFTLRLPDIPKIHNHIETLSSLCREKLL